MNTGMKFIGSVIISTFVILSDITLWESYLRAVVASSLPLMLKSRVRETPTLPTCFSAYNANISKVLKSSLRSLSPGLTRAGLSSQAQKQAVLMTVMRCPVQSSSRLMRMSQTSALI